MAGCVEDDKGALGRREKTVGGVDGDALLALNLQAIEQEREIDVVVRRAKAAGIGFQPAI
jgi:hypothetical protein